MTATGDGNDTSERDRPAEGRAADRDRTESRDGADGHALDTPVAPERVLLGGESIEEVVGAGRGWLAVTSQRLVAFDPDGEGRRLHDPHRLNVDNVEATAAGDPWLLRWTARAGVYGVLLLGGGLLAQRFGLASLLDAGSSGGTLAGIIGAVNTLLITGLLVGGLLVVLAAVVLGGVYLYRRERTLTVELAGDRTVEVAIPDDVDGEDAAVRVQEALADDLVVEE